MFCFSYYINLKRDSFKYKFVLFIVILINLWGTNMKTEKEELKEFLHTEKRTEHKQAKIFFDGKQYSIRIPKKIVDVIEKSYKKDIKEFAFEFTLEKPAAHAENHYPKLTGVLKDGK